MTTFDPIIPAFVIYQLDCSLIYLQNMSSQATPGKRRLSQFPELSSPASKLEFVSGESIKTFIFLRCNVTNINNPALTELAMIAVSKEDLIPNSCGDGMDSGTHVRYKDTLVLAFDPLKPIGYQDGANSNLTSEMLENRKTKPFDAHSVHAINNFLQKQSRPICLLAHNGTTVDFKVLKKEIESLNMTIYSGDGGRLHSVDTLWIFFAMDHASNECGDGVRRELFSEPYYGAENGRSQLPQPSMLDYARYSFENVYRRFLGKFPDANSPSAKSYALCLLEIFRSASGNLLRMLPCRSFLRPSSGGVSPSKLCKNESVTLMNSEHPSTYVAPKDPESDTIQTYVFFDLETTGLDPASCGIAELTMAALHKSQLGNIDINRESNNNLLHELVPRIMDECSLMIRPLDDISEGASRINGLTTDGFDARGISCFTRRITGMLEDFLSRQAKPICLVAHNGSQFDFPILDIHLKRAQTHHQIWNEIYCSDTYPGLRELVHRSSYSLSAIYDGLIGNSLVHPPAHTAEGDVLRLISIIKMLPEDLLQWLDENKRLFRAN